MAALVFPVLIGSAGLGMDVSLWLAQKRNLQTAVDAAALSAAYEASMGFVDFMEDAARREALNNGFDPDNANEFSIIYNNDTGMVDVSFSHPANFWLASFFVDDVNIRANASARVSAPDGDFCILSLDENADGAISTSGTANINQPDCGLAANSRSNIALQLNGTSDILIGDVALRGDMDIDGGSTFEYTNLLTNMPMVADPYEDLEVPDYTPCAQGQMNRPTRVNDSGTVILSPGTYCGGISITGNNDIEFEPGVYIIDGGSLDVIGDGTLYGEGVSFVLTNSGGTEYGRYGSVNISGGRNVYLGAPLPGEEMEGVVFYQDRYAPESNSQTNSLTGSSDLVIDGVAYFPSQGVEFGGNDTTGTATCSKIIAKTVKLSGTPNLDNSCTGKGTKDFAPPSVRLIF
jgi:hypothetical protein